MIKIDDFTSANTSPETTVPCSKSEKPLPSVALDITTGTASKTTETTSLSSEKEGPGTPPASVAPNVVTAAPKTTISSGDTASVAPDVGAVVQVTATLSNTIKETNKSTLLLKNQKNFFVATGTKLEGSHIHGEPIKRGCCKVAIMSVTITGSKTWFPDQFGENKLEKGNIVQWPISHTTCSSNVSPLTTRSKRKR